MPDAPGFPTEVEKGGLFFHSGEREVGVTKGVDTLDLEPPG